jgi:hypothetical protein
MNHLLPKTIIRGLLACAAALLITGRLAADRIELTDGSIINGKLLSADGGKFKVETNFAGTIEIAQDKIKSFTTDGVVHVGLKTGSEVLGKVDATETGVKVSGADAQMTAETGNIVAVWPKDADSPAVEKAKRKWAYEAGVGISGRTGVSEKFSAALNFLATLESSQDKLIFHLAGERARDNGVDTANRQFGSVDYSSFFSDKNVWYVRSSLEKDEIKQLDLRSTTGFGVGRKLIKKDTEDLEVRFGISYIYETYSNGTKFDSPGLDIALINMTQFKNGVMRNVITYTPAFEDFANYRIHHESSYEMPITASMWKLKLGLTNDYQSIPPAGVERFDTLYFTSLILNWK